MNQHHQSTLAAYLRLGRRRLNFVCYRMGVISQDCEDIIQEALTITLESKTEILDYESWLVKTIKNQCIMWHRTNKKHVTRFTAIHPKHEEMNSALHLDIDAKIDGERLIKLSAMLKPKIRRVLMMKIGGAGEKEISQSTGYAATSIQKIYHRAARQIKRGME